MSQVTDRMDLENWQNNRNASLGGAGVSLAIALVALQVAVAKPGEVYVAMTCAFLAVPFWLAVWQMCATVILWGKAGREHAARLPWLFLGLGIFSIAALLLLTAVASLVNSFCGTAWAVFFCLLVIVLFSVSCYHSHCVQGVAEQTGQDSSK